MNPQIEPLPPAEEGGIPSGQEEGCPASELAGDGGAALDLVGEGCPASDLAGDGGAALDLMEEGCPASDLAGDGGAALDLMGEGCPASDLAGDGGVVPDLPGEGEDISSAPAEPENEELSFAQMLDRQEGHGAPKPALEQGQRVSVRVVAVTGDTVFVSTGDKVDGIVEREEMERDGELICAVGDVLDLYVVNVSPQEVRLSRILRGAGSLNALREARESGLPVEGKVTGLIKGGYAVDIMKRRAFCPLSQIDLHPARDPESHVGKIYPFLITRLEKSGRNIVVSRRSLLEREYAENREEVLASLQVGDVREAVATRFAPFGVFLELAPGVEGLAHLSELSWSRVGQADEVLSIGDRLRVKVLEIERDKNPPRISLSLRQATDDPWVEGARSFSPGDMVCGKVTRLAPFGAFVEILPGMEGLVHVSELSHEKRILKVEEVLAPGDTVSVKIKEVDPDKRRMSLSLRDAVGNPWDNVRDILPVDAEISGTVERHSPYGIFVSLSPGITGLLPKASLASSPSRKNLENLAPGSAIQVRVKEIDSQRRRVGLIPVDAAQSEAPLDKDWKKHLPKPQPVQAVGSLGLALQAALQKKKK
ncbi:MAG: S1 RNA-binding domain-containing protein [Desulfovibrio sp.]|nr:S1 RNA-binding domain-containing protein [Desulfovibrio sp.]